jgi:hypothetical protein
MRAFAIVKLVERAASGPAKGIGFSESEAWNDAMLWSKDEQRGYHAIEITVESFWRIKEGDLLAWEPCE